MRSFLIALAAVSIVLFTGCGDTQGQKVIDNPKPMEGVPSISESDKQEFLAAINDARGKDQHCGSKGDFKATNPVRWNDALYKAAYEHNYDMAYSGIINNDHTGSGTEYDYTAQKQNLGKGSTFDQRIKNNGYTGNTPWLENLTAGTNTDTAEKAVKAWLEHAGHCANLMNPDVKEVGMSRLKKDGTKYTNYWTQDFGGSQ